MERIKLDYRIEVRYKTDSGEMDYICFKQIPAITAANALHSCEVECVKDDHISKIISMKIIAIWLNDIRID